MERFKVRVYVSNNPGDRLSDQVFDMPAIPRKGDHLNITYKDKFEGYQINTVVEVAKVYLEINDSKLDATIHVELRLDLD